MAVDACRVVELRQYTLRPGRRDDLIELFDRALIEPQEAAGMAVIGQFRDLDRPDRFVWLRGFPDMERRRRSLEDLYGGPAWKRHREAANATMADSDDVLLLRPAAPTSGFAMLPARLDERDWRDVLLATICSLVRPAPLDATDAAAMEALAVFVEDLSPNTFPSLPVRTGEHVVVWFQRARADKAKAVLHAAAVIAARRVPGLVGPPFQLRLSPTSRSRLR